MRPKKCGVSGSLGGLLEGALKSGRALIRGFTVIKHPLRPRISAALQIEKITLGPFPVIAREGGISEVDGNLKALWNKPAG